MARQIARWVSRKQQTLLILVQVWVISLLGVGVGIVAGLLPGYLQTISSFHMEDIIIPPLFSLPAGLLPLTLASMLALLASSMIIGIHVSRININQVLRKLN